MRPLVALLCVGLWFVRCVFCVCLVVCVLCCVLGALLCVGGSVCEGLCCAWGAVLCVRCFVMCRALLCVRGRARCVCWLQIMTPPNTHTYSDRYPTYLTQSLTAAAPVSSCALERRCLVRVSRYAPWKASGGRAHTLVAMSRVSAGSPVCLQECAPTCESSVCVSALQPPLNQIISARAEARSCPNTPPRTLSVARSTLVTAAAARRRGLCQLRQKGLIRSVELLAGAARRAACQHGRQLPTQRMTKGERFRSMQRHCDAAPLHGRQPVAAAGGRVTCGAPGGSWRHLLRSSERVTAGAAWMHGRGRVAAWGCAARCLHACCVHGTHAERMHACMREAPLLPAHLCTGEPGRAPLMRRTSASEIETGLTKLPAAAAAPAGGGACDADSSAAPRALMGPAAAAAAGDMVASGAEARCAGAAASSDVRARRAAGAGAGGRACSR